MPMPSSQIWRKIYYLVQVYTRRFKNVVSTSLRVDLEFIALDHDLLHFASLATDPPLPTIMIDTSAYSNLDLFIAYRKGK